MPSIIFEKFLLIFSTLEAFPSDKFRKTFADRIRLFDDKFSKCYDVNTPGTGLTTNAAESDLSQEKNISTS